MYRLRVVPSEASVDVDGESSREVYGCDAETCRESLECPIPCLACQSHPLSISLCFSVVMMACRCLLSYFCFEKAPFCLIPPSLFFFFRNLGNEWGYNLRVAASLFVHLFLQNYNEHPSIFTSIFMLLSLFFENKKMLIYFYFLRKQNLCLLVLLPSLS